MEVVVVKAGPVAPPAVLAVTPQACWLSVGGMLAEAPQTYW